MQSIWNILLLAFTRPKAGREVGALNWSQEHKSVWDGPASKATLRSAALVARADFLKIGHFAPFSQFLHINGLNFPDVFIRSRLPITGCAVAPALC